jgi:putative Mg2+ transporter-C (MgtC) family protein
MTLAEIAIRLATALALGAVIGFERQWRQRMAGLRTNALVATGAAGFVVFALRTFGATSGAPVVAQIVSGIGFLGAGVILREGLTVSGLNTAATLWCSAMVGTFAGGGELVAAAVAAAAVVATNLFLRPLVRMINREATRYAPTEVDYVVSVRCRSSEEARVRALLLQGVASVALGLRQLDSVNLEGGDSVEVTASLHSATRNDAALEQIVGRLSLESQVTAARWRAIEIAE